MDSLFRELSANPTQRKLVLMPVSRLLLDSPRKVDCFRVFPPGFVDINKLRPVPNRTLTATESDIYMLSGQELRETLTSLTGFGIDVLLQSPLVAFTDDIDWNVFLSANHKDDIELLRHLFRLAERAFDLVRYHFCRFDLLDTLPGLVGSWKGSDPYLGALLYSLEDNESYMIAGDAIDCSIVVKGIGLELDRDITDRLPNPADGEVAGNAVHALTLFSDAMYSSNDTMKFIRIMTLLEFLASPDEYMSWKKVKSDIACHCANDKQRYHELCERFRSLSSMEDANGLQKGFRTLIVHHGRFIEDIILNRTERLALFRELQSYCQQVLNDMLENRQLTWAEFKEFRSVKKKMLGV